MTQPPFSAPALPAPTTPPPGRRSRRRHTGAYAAAGAMLAPAPFAPPTAWLPALLAALALTAALHPWPTARLTLTHAAATTATASLALDLAYPGPPGLPLLWLPFEAPALLLLLYRTIRHLPRHQAPALATLTATAALTLPLRLTLHDPRTGLKESLFLMALATVPTATTALAARYLRALDTRRTHAVALARHQQRLELAEDLHDFVAHELTGIVLEAQAAQLDAEETPNDGTERPDAPAGTQGPAHPAHPALLARIEAAGLRALDSMDRTVQTLRQGPALAALPDLVARFTASTPATVSLHLDPALLAAHPSPLSPEAEDTAYRTVLESLTNIRRHAPGSTRVEVTADRPHPNTLRLTVTNATASTPPAPPTVPRPASGTGLPTLTARITTLGGTLTAGPTDHEPGTEPPGWRVTCLLPLNAHH
ncbi:sensor histidine kinase [Streptomyces sp. NPDC058000]|uniref:sensor histidine kinase n=1 Tax=Streptomyces sp. NPDC058000 TaxID=3346299 RepID=UPI0036E94889